MAHRTVFASAFLFITLLLAVPTSDAQKHSLSFEERVRAQEAIERIYYSHQIGVTQSFDEVVTREVLERKVRTYLEQSVALERLWDTRITSEALRQEWERIASNTRYPDRLREIAEALDWDPVLLFECLARPALVNRLVGNFYAHDDRLHAGARHEAKKLRELLFKGDLTATASRAQVRQVHLKRAEVDSPSGEPARQRFASADPARPEVVVLDPGTYRARRSRAPQSTGQVSEIIEGRGAFEIRVLLESGADHALVASYFVPKQGRDAWWREARGSFGRGSATPFTDLAEEDLRSVTERVLGFTGAFDPSCVPDDTWDNGILEDPNPARDGHSAVWTGTEMIIWGGGELNSGLRYDPLLDVFTPTSREDAPSPRSFHTAVWTGSEMIVWGGWPSTNTGGRYDPVQDSWTPIATDGAPEARFDHTAVWTGYAMVVWGGNADGSTPLGTGGKYFPGSNAWAPTRMGSAPVPRERHSAVWTGSEMIVWGGLGPDYLDDGGRYDPLLDRWVATTPVGAPEGTADHIAVWTGSQMIVWGGLTATGSHSGGSRYDPVLNSWAAISSSGAPTGGDGEVGVWAGNELLVWRGTDPGAQGRYDPAGDSWSAMSTGPNATPALLATAVWTGDSMIVWSPASGGRYDPQLDSWSSTLQLMAPEGPSDRTGHTAIWTGNHMIVWGGPPSADPPGSRYDPLLETWTPVSAVDAPVIRRYHTAVWTGTEMIVWGGANGSISRGDGGRYNPATDDWADVSDTLRPQPRHWHTAVWTGTEMIVWGGFGSDGVNTGTYDDGRRYDPTTDSWSLMSATETPSERYHHTAVWAGTEMIVWGGRQDALELDTGARYNPTADSWQAVSATSTPSARREHTAVWTGTEMIVWGGTGSEDFNSGSRYTPATDSWSPTTLDGAPAPRAEHTAIWTGHEMVVWGGGSFLNSGSRYQPDWDIWRETSPAGAPAARNAHTAVWTDDLMIVWGGSEPLGGRYALGHPDNDGDGIADGCLACPDGPGDDSDGDGVVCASDNCPFDSNTGQGDEDEDGWGDACDPCLDDPINDADYDLVCHSVDNCSSAYNPDQSDADGDGAGDVCDPNDDTDSLPDTEDNCRVDANDDQTDSDGDGAGDACDPCVWDPDDDIDDDGTCGDIDNCPTTPNPDQSDVDGYYPGDACDICPTDPFDRVIGDGLCFAPQVLYPTSQNPQSVTIGQFDEDGDSDIVTANKGLSNVKTFLNNGDGSLGSTGLYDTGLQPLFVRAADLNQDGISDLVTVDSNWDPLNQPLGSISVLFGTGTWFEDRVVYGVGRHPRTLALDDYDVDGDLDIVVANQVTADLSYFEGSVYGNFFSEVPFPTESNRQPELVISGDFNNDQIPDLAVSILDEDYLQIYLGSGDGTFSYLGVEDLGTGETITSHTTGDFDEDGTLDLAVAHANRVTILTGTGTGDFLIVGDILAGDQGGSIQVGDFNRDGHADLVMTNAADLDISILTGDGNAGFASDVRIPTEARPKSVAVGDLTGDGRHSLAVANDQFSSLSILLNRGQFGPSAPQADAGPNITWLVPAESPAGTVVPLDGSRSSDSDSTPGTADDIVLYEWIEDLGLSSATFLGLGKSLDVFLDTGGHRVTLRTTDKRGLSDTDVVIVSVIGADQIPDVTLEFTPSTLWPPNHRMVELQLSLIPGPDCSNPTAILGSVSSTEEDDAPGPADGVTVNDIQDAYEGYPDHTIRLRAERSNLTPGRTYWVRYKVSCPPAWAKSLLFPFDIPFERNGTAEPLQIVLDETNDGTLVAWSPVPDAQHYDVIRGSLSNLQPVADAYELGDVTCIEPNSIDESTAGFEDPDEPAGGEAYFYLVQYHEEDDSGYGTESALKPRIPGGGDCM